MIRLSLHRDRSRGQRLQDRILSRFCKALPCQGKRPGAWVQPCHIYSTSKNARYQMLAAVQATVLMCTTHPLTAVIAHDKIDAALQGYSKRGTSFTR